MHGELILLGLFGLLIADLGFAWSRHKTFGLLKGIWTAVATDLRLGNDRLFHAVNDSHNTVSSMLGELHAKVDKLSSTTPMNTAVLILDKPDEWVQIAAQKTGHSVDELERIGDVVRSKVGHSLIATVTVNVH